MKKIHLLLLIKSQYVSLQLRAANCIYFSQNKLYYVKLLERTIVIVGKSAQISCTSYTSSLRVSQIEIAGCGLGTQCTLSSGGTGSSVLAGFLGVPVLWQCPQHSQPSRVPCSPLPRAAGNCHSFQWRCPETAQEQSQPGLHRPIPSTPPAAQASQRGAVPTRAQCARAPALWGTLVLVCGYSSAEEQLEMVQTPLGLAARTQSTNTNRPLMVSLGAAALGQAAVLDLQTSSLPLMP